MTHHVLKCFPQHYQPKVSGDMAFDIRYNDRLYQKGDTVTYREYDPPADPSHEGQFTGNEATFRITIIVSGWGLSPGYVTFGISPKEPS